MFLKPLLSLNRRVGGRPLLEFIDRQSAAVSATVSISWTKEYEAVFIFASNIDPATNDTELHLLTSADGTTYDSGASDYGWNTYIVGGTALVPDSNSSAAFIQCLGEVTASNGMGTNGHLDITIHRPYDTAVNTEISGTGGMIGGGGGSNSTGFTGVRLSNGAVQGVQFAASSGNLTSGEFIAYGLVK